jgi:hypothetical protein
MAELCDTPDCTTPAMFRLYAAYNADDGENAHPLHARYPIAMHRSCMTHVAATMLVPDRLATGQWLVIRCPSTSTFDRHE